MTLALPLTLTLLLASSGLVHAAEWTLIDTRKIADTAGHSAFTDLIRYKDTWLCVFRESTKHVPGTDGVIRVLRSKDGTAWESAAVLEEKGVDLRDPKISVAPDGRLHLLIGGSIYDGDETSKSRKSVAMHPRVSFSNDGSTWTAPAKIEAPASHWLWRITWHNGTGYGVAYSPQAKNTFTAALWSTTDGTSYKLVAPIAPPGAQPNETTLRFLPDGTMLAFVRSEDPSRHAWFGRSHAPYTDWQWTDAAHAAQGPNFLPLPDGRLVYSGRDFPDGKAAKTVVGEIRDAHCTPLVTLPSGGDCSYPGLAWHENELWVSYYSSHEGKSSIYLSRLRSAP
jgi:hypothetical protein